MSSSIGSCISSNCIRNCSTTTSSSSSSSNSGISNSNSAVLQITSN